MDSSLEKLDIKDIINKSYLHTARCPAGMLSVLMYQSLAKRGHDVQLMFKMIVDEGRSPTENVFALQYQGELWTVHGKGDWDYQLMHALKKHTQTWKNPTYTVLGQDIESEVVKKFSIDPLPVHEKIRARIEKAVILAEAKALDTSTASPSTTRSRSHRL